MSAVPWDRVFYWSHTKERETLAALDSIHLQNVKVVSRIGSESSNGRVYKVTHNGTAFAMKVGPLNSKTEHEVRIAVKLGNEARRDNDMPFLMTYGSGEISQKEAQERFGYDCTCFYIIMELAAGDVTQAFTNARAVLKSEGESGLAQWAHTHQRLLFPELANLSMRRWRDTVAWQMYSAMQKLHQYGLVHNDIHSGNFLTLRSGKIVISDFGATKDIKTPSDVWNETDHFRDTYSEWHKFTRKEATRITDWGAKP